MPARAYSTATHPGEIDHPGLGGIIRGNAVIGPQTRNGGGVDDGPAAVLAHDRDCLLHGVKDGRQTQVYGIVPDAIFQVGCAGHDRTVRPGRGQPKGIIMQKIESAKGSRRGRNHPVEVGLLGHIGDNPQWPFRPLP